MFMRFTLYMLVMIGLLFLAESCQRSVNEAINLVHVCASSAEKPTC
jgi:hypothetical protein